MSKTAKIDPSDPYWYAKMNGIAYVICLDIVKYSKTKTERKNIRAKAKEWLDLWEEKMKPKKG